ncbi:hypothetical protein NliqN6_0158 [Naganishia liquefaciens]|uniref:Uncharacterized protein n=1 Tax=Naganishia liquefaciens TaxID=104408 RepID=A0A8H3YDG1_9TREE|nr:hypothetical protein NliqN6_0158 [Naganishia liquefaciens]
MTRNLRQKTVRAQRQVDECRARLDTPEGDTIANRQALQLAEDRLRELNERKLHQSSKISSQDTRQPSTQEFCHAVCRPTAGPSSCSRIDFSDPSAAKLSPAHDADAQHQSSSIEKDPGVEKEIVAKPVTRKEDTPEGRKTPDTDPSQARECKILGQRQDGGLEEGFSDRQADLEGFVVSEKATPQFYQVHPLGSPDPRAPPSELSCRQGSPEMFATLENLNITNLTVEICGDAPAGVPKLIGSAVSTVPPFGDTSPIKSHVTACSGSDPVFLRVSIPVRGISRKADFRENGGRSSFGTQIGLSRLSIGGTRFCQRERLSNGA